MAKWLYDLLRLLRNFAVLKIVLRKVLKCLQLGLRSKRDEDLAALIFTTMNFLIAYDNKA